jgi:hypothetical protein
MRTTVTLEPDTEKLLKEESHKTGKSFKKVLNEAVRTALSRRSEGKTVLTPLFEAPFPPAVENANFNRLGSDWDEETTLDELSA